jgi:hypothetical protein
MTAATAPGGVPLTGTYFQDRACQLVGELVHMVKSILSSALCIDGWFVGMLLIVARYYDVDPDVRRRLRTQVTQAALRNKNKFSIETAVEVVHKDLARALITDAEGKAGVALVASGSAFAAADVEREH